MLLTPMRYKDYVWPHNPTVYSITYERQVALHKVPFGRYYMQDLGQSCRVMRGEGVFYGEGAYDEFKKLATVFYGGGAGLLIHPVWQISNAYFTSLRLEQEPLPDYVRYSFTFHESYDEYDASLAAAPSAGSAPAESGATAVTCTVASGDTLWGIAMTYDVALESLLEANPGIKNPNFIQVGDQVVIPC